MSTRSFIKLENNHSTNQQTNNNLNTVQPNQFPVDDPFTEEFWLNKSNPIKAEFEKNWDPDIYPNFWGSRIPKELNTTEFWDKLIEDSKLQPAENQTNIKKEIQN